jgi:glycosyltransferase involved in cell wall biosynthesis
MSNFYLQKYIFCNPQLVESCKPETGIIVVIPCYHEENLIASLQSLLECQQTKKKVEVIVVINASEKEDDTIKQFNQQTHHELMTWIEKNPSPFLTFHAIIKQDLPEKHAGVGLARKIGMDEAVFRFESIQHDGVIVCFDADSKCDDNYLREIEFFFDSHPKTTGVSIYFEHPLEGNQFEAAIFNGIINYELHLRYYKQGLQFAQLPYAYHTIGSSMAVRSSVYQKQGGMNKRKAGEDFYFLQKVIALGNFHELNTTRVIPSPRPSSRVPFGTGRAINNWLLSEKDIFYSYHPQSFFDLKKVQENLSQLYTNSANFLKVLPKSLVHFFNENDFQEAYNEMKENTANQQQFNLRFFQWFNAFKVLKFVHFARDHYYPDISIVNASAALVGLPLEYDAKKLLMYYRKLDKNE